MRRSLAMWSGAALAALCLAQSGVTTLTDPSGSFVLRFRDFSIQNAAGPVVHWEMTNPGGLVYAASKRQGIEFYAPRMAVDAVASTGKQVNTIKSATAGGGVRAIRTGPTGRSEITGSTAKYAATDAGAKLTLTGPVKMTSSISGNQSFEATGTELSADLGPPSAKTAVGTATLRGPIRLLAHKASRAPNDRGDLRVSAGRMVYSELVRPATIRLLGGVSIDGTIGGATLRGTSSEIVLTLSDRGEVVGISGKEGR